MLNKIIYTILGIGLILVFFPRPVKDEVKSPQILGSETQAPKIPHMTATPEMAMGLPAPVLTAKAAVTYDLSSGSILYAKNLDEKLPIASLTKMMTALTVLKSQDVESVVTITKQDQGLVGSSIGLVAGEKIKINDLLQAMLIPSSNDAAVSLANYISGSEDKFADLMNQEGVELGLTNTHFTNPVGWDIGDNYSNILDLLKIVKEFLKNPKLREIVKTKETTVYSTDKKYIHELRTTNKFLLDDPEVAGIKTGFTEQAKGNLVILVNHSGAEIITIVLGSDNREEDTQKLLDWTFEVYKW